MFAATRRTRRVDPLHRFTPLIQSEHRLVRVPDQRFLRVFQSAVRVVGIYRWQRMPIDIPTMVLSC